MERYLILATERFDGKAFIVDEYFGAEERIIYEAMRVFREGTMQKVVVVNAAFEIIFKNTRRCKCTNVQKELSPSGDLIYREKCMDCGIVINHRGYIKELPVKAEVTETVGAGV